MSEELVGREAKVLKSSKASECGCNTCQRAPRGSTRHNIFSVTDNDPYDVYETPDGKFITIEDLVGDW